MGEEWPFHGLLRLSELQDHKASGGGRGKNTAPERHQMRFVGWGYGGEVGAFRHIPGMFQLPDLQEYQTDLDGSQMPEVQSRRTPGEENEKGKPYVLRMYPVSRLRFFVVGQAGRSGLHGVRIDL